MTISATSTRNFVTDVGEELTYSVNAATNSQQRATELLEAAKHAVKIAIEDSEVAALDYMDEILQDTGGHRGNA